MEALTPDHVQAALDSFNLGIKIRLFENSTATSQLAADNIGCELGQIAKSLAFIIDGQPIVVIASGDQRVDDKKLAALYNVGRKKVRPATPEQCVEIYGYAPGGVAPLGYRTPGLPVLLDESLRRYTQIYAAGGAHNAIFPVTLDQLAQISGGQFADVKKDVGVVEGE
ncbi:MAG: YbaK/EbsC family protein [Anaerolineae bacterium]|nr:YbaK/EbsC family protein [Anaerolineae bacterium]